MDNTKRLSVALLILGLSTPAFADSAVMEPTQSGGFKVGIDALYLQPNSTNTSYGVTGTFASEPLQEEYALTPNTNYNWGFYAEVGYLIPGVANDVTLGYMQLHTNATNSIIQPSTNFIYLLPASVLFSPGALEGVAISFESAANEITFDLNATDLEAGQRFITDDFDLRMFAGLRYTHLDYASTTNAAIAPNPGVEPSALTVNQEFASEFSGIGPRIGADGRYCLMDSGFGVDAHVSAALLVGSVTSHYNVVANTTHFDGVTVQSNFEATDANSSRVVPNIDVKLGVDYTYPIDEDSKSTLVFEAGYQATNYFDVSDRPLIINTNPHVGTLNASLVRYTTNDVKFNGIYLGVKYCA